MNDPLRDNRIFPEEMQEHAPVAVMKHRNFSWFWFALSAGFIIFLLWFAFIYQKGTGSIFFNQGPNEYQQQVAVFEKLNADRPVMTADQRADKINTLFGNQ